MSREGGKDAGWLPLDPEEPCQKDTPLFCVPEVFCFPLPDSLTVSGVQWAGKVGMVLDGHPLGPENPDIPD